MKKPIFLIAFYIFLTVKIHAQNAQNIELNFTKPSKLLSTEKLSLWKYGSKGTGTITTSELKIALKKPEPFIAFSIAIEGIRIDAEAVEMSILIQQDGIWQKEWLPFSHNHDAENDALKIVSNMVELDKTTTAIKVRFKIKSSDIRLKRAKIRLFAAGNISTGDIKTALEARGDCALPPSVSRAIWGAQWSLSNDKIYKGSPSYSAVTHLIVHHSAGNNTSTNWAAVVASYFDLHVNTNGWSDIGYNWLIAPDGTLFVGRGGGNNVVGAHMCGYNNNTMGVCLIGNFTSVEPTQAALDKLQQLLAWKASESGIEPMSYSTIRSYSGTMNNISGHRDGCAPDYTECPGDKLYPKLPTIRQNVKNLTATCVTTNTQDMLGINDFKIYPNPNQGEFNLEIKSTELENKRLVINILNTQGQIIHTQNMAPQTSEINEKIFLTNITKGIYMLRLSDGEKYVTRKFQIF